MPPVKERFLMLLMVYAESRLWTVLLIRWSLLAIARTLRPSLARRVTFSRSTINRIFCSHVCGSILATYGNQIDDLG